MKSIDILDMSIHVSVLVTAIACAAQALPGFPQIKKIFDVLLNKMIL